jgi:Spy/CpxP family protein refolding chaperone
MKKSLLVVLLAVAGLCGGFGTYALSDVMGADSPATEPSYGQGWHPGMLARFVRAEIGRWITLRNELDLTPAQRDQIHQILLSHKDQIVAVMGPVAHDRRALRDAIADPNSDEQTIRADADKLGHSMGDAAVLAAQIKKEIAPILTPDQLQKLSNFRAQSDHAVDDFFQKVSAQ